MANPGWPQLDHLIGGGMDLFGHLDDVGAQTFGHINSDGGRPVDIGVFGGVLERAGDGGDIAKGHHGIAHGFQRQVEHILGRVDQTRHLQTEGAFAIVQRATRDHHVVARQRVEQLACGQVIGLQVQLVDPHLQHLVPGAAQLDLLHIGQILQHILQLVRTLDQGALGHLAINGDGQDGAVGKADFVDRRLVGIGGQFAYDTVQLGADIGQRLILVGVDRKLKENRHMALTCGDRDVFQPVHIVQPVLDRFGQQFHRIIGRNAALADRDIEIRDVDGRKAFLGHRLIRDATTDQQHGHHGQNHTRHPQNAFDQVQHRACPTLPWWPRPPDLPSHIPAPAR